MRDVEALKRDGLNILAPDTVEMIRQNSELLSNLFLTFFLLTFAIAILIISGSVLLMLFTLGVFREDIISSGLMDETAGPAFACRLPVI